MRAYLWIRTWWFREPVSTGVLEDGRNQCEKGERFLEHRNNKWHLKACRSLHSSIPASDVS